MIAKNYLLSYDNYFIYQDVDYFKFSLDSVLLCDFVKRINLKYKYFDLCSGNCPIPLFLTIKYGVKFWGIEIQKDIYDLGLMSILVNRLENNIKLINGDLRNVSSLFKPESFDVVTCNPPYFRVDNDNSIISSNSVKACARHEVLSNIDDIIKASSYLLKNQGSLYIVFRTERIGELLQCLKKYNLEAKVIRFIHSRIGDESSLFLLEAVKCGRCGVKVLSPLIIYDGDNYTEEVNKIINERCFYVAE